MRVADILMTALLMLLMAFQVTGQFVHEWLGIAMTVIVTVHQILNRKFYTSVFGGRYNALRFFTTSVNILLLLSFAVSAVSGISMSSHAVVFLSGFLKTTTARRIHLTMSYWSFVLMGIHIGIHMSIIASKFPKGKFKTAVAAVMLLLSGYGLILFFKAGIPSYMFMHVQFVFFDYEKPTVSVLIENLIMLISWAFAAYLISLLLKRAGKKKTAQRRQEESVKRFL